MEISKLKLAVKFIFGGREAALDYVLDCANTFAAKLPDARKEDLKAYLATARKILDTLDAISWLCPAKWRKAYLVTVGAFTDLATSFTDLVLTADELAGLVEAFQIAYAAWRAE